MNLNNLVTDIHNFNGFDNAPDLNQHLDSYRTFGRRLAIANKILGCLFSFGIADFVTAVTERIYANIWSGRFVKKLQIIDQKPENITKFRAEVLDLNKKQLSSKCYAAAIRVALSALYIIAAFGSIWLVHFLYVQAVITNNIAYACLTGLTGGIVGLSFVTAILIDRQTYVNTVDSASTVALGFCLFQQPSLLIIISMLFSKVVSFIYSHKPKDTEVTWIDRLGNKLAGLPNKS